MTQPALFHCVCGADIPIDSSASSVRCPSCQRAYPNPPLGDTGELTRLEEEDAATGESVEGARAWMESLPLPPGDSRPIVAATSSQRDVEAMETRELPVTRDNGETVAAPQADASPCAEPVDEIAEDLTGRSLDHFELLERIGQGGMGTVYRALDRSLERYVAIKVINRREFCRHPERLRDFIHEARAQARINHPGITTIYYIGRYSPDGEETLPYFAMEFVAGRDLASMVAEGPLPFDKVVRYAIDLVRALREASDRGVIHRDIKPANLILTDSGRMKVTDFGLSKTVSESERGGVRITGSHTITGTPYYLAPEQARGESTDFRSDIYSLGASLYHLVYGRPPFEGENFMTVVSRHLADPLTFPADTRPDVPPGFQKILARMMAKRPEDRFQSYRDLERALTEVRPENLVVASSLRRAIAAGIDYALLFLIFLLWGGIVLLADRLTDVPLWVLDQVAWLGILSTLGIVLTLQLVSGRTLGKAFGHLRIADMDGHAVGRWRLAARFAIRFLPLLYLVVSSIVDQLTELATSDDPWVLTGLWIFVIVDFLWIFTNRRRRALHDYLLGTWVLDRQAVER